jgi:dTDP-4-dehydrorhamnose 3,5-epimerase
MKFEPLSVAGAYAIRPEPRQDERGHFARLWCEEEFAAHGLTNRIAQINTAFSARAGTLRGMHFQIEPHAEVKIARCTAGAVFDVVVDLRSDSPTFRRWAGKTLSPENGLMLYIPEGCAHGYLTLVPDSELMYFTSCAYASASARGVRHDDAAFGIEWPEKVALISTADAGWPGFSDALATRVVRAAT